MSSSGLIVAAVSLSGLVCFGLAGCHSQETMALADSLANTDGASSGPVYCSPSDGPIPLDAGLDSGGLSICPGVCKHGAGPQSFGTTPPQWTCVVETGDSGTGSGAH